MARPLHEGTVSEIVHIAGVKIDFMQRDDQDMVAFYRRVAVSPAQHHLMVDFHGAYKPGGDPAHLTDRLVF
jgi:hypothetical protein